MAPEIVYSVFSLDRIPCTSKITLQSIMPRIRSVGTVAAVTALVSYVRICDGIRICRATETIRNRTPVIIFEFSFTFNLVTSHTRLRQYRIIFAKHCGSATGACTRSRGSATGACTRGRRFHCAVLP